MPYPQLINKIQKSLTLLSNQALADDLFDYLNQYNFAGKIKQEKVQLLCDKYQHTPQSLALILLPVAACYANPTISNFSVGAIVLTEQGDYYFGANQEFIGTNIQQTIHAEQSAISHAWIEGASYISDIIINYSPCGHCRQFMNELKYSDKLNIHLPRQNSHSLAEYLPYAFGPKDLNINQRLLDTQPNYTYQLAQSSKTPAIHTALWWLNRSHSPYSHNCQGIAIQTKDGKIYAGSYAENAAFNPSLPALQVALNHLILQGKSFDQIEEVYMLEKVTTLSYRKQAEDLIATIKPIKLHYIEL